MRKLYGERLNQVYNIAAQPRQNRHNNMWQRNAANLNGPRAKQKYRVTGQVLKSYYILGPSTKLASWTAPGVTFLEARCNAEWDGVA